MRTFKEAISIVLNNKGEVALERDDDGALSADNASDILALMEKFSKEQKTQVNSYAYFCPAVDKEGNTVYTAQTPDGKTIEVINPKVKTAPFTDAKAREGRTAEVKANSFGKPYIAMLPAKTAKPGAKSGKRKLA